MAGIPKIGIDAMGGDLGPAAVAAGTALAFREMPGRFSVTLVGDACADRLPVSHEAALLDIDTRYGDVVHTADAERLLSR